MVGAARSERRFSSISANAIHMLGLRAVFLSSIWPVEALLQRQLAA
jgi:hypothetical protein